MGKNSKAITKCCPHCEMQIAVACKICPGCKRVLISNTKRPGPVPAPPPPPPPPPVEVVSRRTSRVKRGKPQFYDASQFERKKQIKRKRNEPEYVRGRQNSGISHTQPQALNKKKIKKKVKSAVKEEQIEEEEPPPINLTSDKIKQFSVVLDELNSKLFSTSWTAI